MKNLVLLVLALAGLTSCSKDSLNPVIDHIQGPVKSEIAVTVSYISWSNDAECEPGCTGERREKVNFIENAKVSLYDGSITSSDAVSEPHIELMTDFNGKGIFTDLEPGAYKIIVETPLGIKSRTVMTQLNKRLYIDFSY